MIKNETNNSKKARQQAGLTILIVSMIVLTILLTGFFVKFSSYNISSSSKEISSSELKAEIETTDDINTDLLFKNKYDTVLTLLSTTVAQGTKWLSICPDSQTTIDNIIYFKSCDENYPTLNSLKEKLESVLTKEYVEELIGNNYIDNEDSLYFTPVATEADETYIEFSSYTAKSVTTNKIIYIVKSKYGQLGCTSGCNYTYKEHKIILEFVDGEWLVSSFEMPY